MMIRGDTSKFTDMSVRAVTVYLNSDSCLGLGFKFLSTLNVVKHNAILLDRITFVLNGFFQHINIMPSSLDTVGQAINRIHQMNIVSSLRMVATFRSVPEEASSVTNRLILVVARVFETFTR